MKNIITKKGILHVLIGIALAFLGIYAFEKLNYGGIKLSSNENSDFAKTIINSHTKQAKPGAKEFIQSLVSEFNKKAIGESLNGGLPFDGGMPVHANINENGIVLEASNKQIFSADFDPTNFITRMQGGGDKDQVMALINAKPTKVYKYNQEITIIPTHIKMRIYKNYKSGCNCIVLFENIQNRDQYEVSLDLEKSPFWMD